MAQPFSMAPDFSWVDEGADPVQAAAEAAAARNRNAVRSHYGRPEGKATAVLDSLGTSIYNTAAKPSRIWGALGEVPPGQPLSERPDIVDAVAQTSTDLLGAPALLPGGIVKGAAGIFGGKLAQTADVAGLKRAEEMAGGGAGREAIWNETGWFQGRDGHWRFEIPDAGSTFNAEKMMPKQYRIFGNLVPGREGVAGEVMNHPGFFAAYPDAARMSVGQTNYGGGNRGTYHPPGMIDEQIGLDASLLEGPARQVISDGARGVMLHEMQHRTQQAEGFARGGDPKTIGTVVNPDLFRYRDALKNDKELQRYLEIHSSPGYQAEIDAQNKIWSGEYQPRLDAIYARGKDYIPGDADQVFADFNKFKIGKYPLDEETEGLFKSLKARGVPLREPSPTLSGSDLYSRLAGEVEARNVQARMNLSPEERRAKPPWATEDTPADRQVVFDRDGPVVGPAGAPMSMSPTIKKFDFSNPGGGSRTAQIGNTEVTYGVGKDGVEVTLLKTPRALRGEGSGRAAMEKMIAEADAGGHRLMLNADPMDKGISKNKLVDFYKSLGFRRNAGRYRDFTTRAEFIREPKAPGSMAPDRGD